MTLKHIKRATEIWNARAKYFNRLFDGLANVREEPEGEDFRHRYLTVGDQVLISSGCGEIRLGYIWKIMGFGDGYRNYFVFVPALGKTLVRASSFIAKDV